MNDLAEVIKNLNRLKESEELFRKALKFRKENLSPNNPDIGTSMNGLTGILKI